MLQLQEVRLGLVAGTGFDVHVTTDPNAELTRASASFVGSIALFRHVSPNRREVDASAHLEHGSTDEGTESFDGSRAVSAIDMASLHQVRLVLVPYALLTVPGKETVLLSRDALTVRGVAFAVSE